MPTRKALITRPLMADYGLPADYDLNSAARHYRRFRRIKWWLVPPLQAVTFLLALTIAIGIPILLHLQGASFLIGVAVGAILSGWLIEAPDILIQPRTIPNWRGFIAYRADMKAWLRAERSTRMLVRSGTPGTSADPAGVP